MPIYKKHNNNSLWLVLESQTVFLINKKILQRVTLIISILSKLPIA